MAENVSTENTETEIVVANYIPNTKKNIILHGTEQADNFFLFSYKTFYAFCHSPEL